MKCDAKKNRLIVEPSESDKNTGPIYSVDSKTENCAPVKTKINDITKRYHPLNSLLVLFFEFVNV